MNVFELGPVPPFNNVPIAPQYFIPQAFFISAITLGQTTTVTTTVNMDYVIRQQVRLLIPKSSGCRQLNNLIGYVIDIPAPNQVVIDIDSSKNVNQFTTSTAKTQPQIIAIGDINSGVINRFGPHHLGTFIPGSFINISP